MSKLETFIQHLRRDRIINVKLPSIKSKQHKPKTNQTKIHHQNQNQKFNHPYHSNQGINQIKVSYSRPKPAQQAIAALRLKIPRTRTQPSGNYNNLTKLQQKIMMQIKNIDVCLQSQRKEKIKKKQNGSLFAGYLFLKNVNEDLVQKFYQCLQMHSEASYSVTDGFEVQRYASQENGEWSLVAGDIVNKVPSLGNKLLTKSIETIKEFDEQKVFQYEKNYGKEWSMRNNYIENPNHQHQLQKELISRNYSLRSHNDSLINKDSKFTLKSSLIQPTDTDSTKLCQSKLTFLTKNSKIASTVKSVLNQKSILLKKPQNENSNFNSILKQNSHQNFSILKSEDNSLKLSHKDVRIMLEKNKNVVSIWLPPASYPQFFAIFTYRLIKQQHKNKVYECHSCKCKINKYFFSKFSLNKKVFDAIIEMVTFQTNLLIEALEITVEKTVFNRIFAKLGWCLKSWQSSTTIKANYFKQIHPK